MSRLLESYAQGTWYSATDEGTPLLSAVDGSEIARVSSSGLDVAGMVDYARTVGGPALAALTFHERAALLKQLGLTLLAGKEEFYQLSRHTGATTRDSGVDIDGGFGTVLSYASKARRELPNETVYLDGAIEQLGKKGTFLGQHIYTSRRGVAVQINAFNFPVWGFLEKLAPAFIAGVPSIVKPASQTAYLTELVFRRIIESGLLPEGSVQLLCGSARGVLDHLGGQDSVAFTGSADTAATLRSHPNVVGEGLHFTAEADSLNASILGSDVTQDDPEFDLFVKGVFTEMTAKAGQKCTAIRRVLVPQDSVEPVIEALKAKLEKVVVGDPADDGVTMGALASIDQRDEVLKSIRGLTKSATVVFGDPETVDQRAGAFMAPVLLKAGDKTASEPHEIEAFGPVSTVIGYENAADLLDLVARGKGSLVASLVTKDAAIAREVVLGSAPYHGRILVLNSEDAKESTGHGSPLPVLVHGGPGRAGGGEELGGIRGVLHHMQRTAIQGTPDVLTAIGNKWVAGAKQTTGDVHPFRKNLGELKLGDTIIGGPRQVTRADIDHFAEFTGDTFYAHTDPEAAAANPLFGGIVAHGYLVVSLAAGLFVDPAPGPVLANFGVDNLRFLTPVKAEDSLTVTLTAKLITPRQSADYGEVRWDAVVVNQDGDPVATYDVLTLVAKPEAAS
ncbi:phenylacetic acid degradation bifunctional protein PaaZ [Rhodococcus sp. 15-725-2-2b]|uniref:phenylacetic acid degradation bifunctional protein PaaZ n=1 Tax=unclassified Rhodococcus (in: high G+C Gram-positive bacteria) TaxID=192944 RepID=UPI000B9B4D18|nr:MULTISPECIES: phenylacetic acid degradation bifunctional protein PaaZ [unclassified Rhodococcus (in: high G+C Gram-positive bacteria)]OZC61699.1 phenylacetic acid degradation bifunctional protein PaaZ [Rhodococcus sp. 06-469-3-2]OZD42988.1 phenylacetic acid degradation bifunctional protein PaaZ [Rhodococcus sp. 06-1477-1A]OZE11110.1 phenylacetic acid degradation bifunctional protein PaaZ [Rhodococcus sp. 05-2255-3C]OZE14266.1 phenylacetic acid degradation bifunctional protein PaaZ [Rhodococc